jgi:hypothetical protein
MRHMAGRALNVASRILFFLCGLATLLTAAPYVMLRGVGLPYESEWIIFVVAFALVGVFSLVVAVLPRSRIAKICKMEKDDRRLFSTPLKILGAFAAIFYLFAVAAYFAPRRWDLDPQIMVSLCPMYIVKMDLDPPPVIIFCVLAPMNAAVYGSLGLTFGYVWLALRRKES